MRKSDKPITKVTLNLYNYDILYMEQHYGRGWTEIVRNLVAEHVTRERMHRMWRTHDAHDD